MTAMLERPAVAERVAWAADVAVSRERARTERVAREVVRATAARWARAQLLVAPLVILANLRRRMLDAEIAHWANAYPLTDADAVAVELLMFGDLDWSHHATNYSRARAVACRRRGGQEWLDWCEESRQRATANAERWLAVDILFRSGVGEDVVAELLGTSARQVTRFRAHQVIGSPRDPMMPTRGPGKTQDQEHPHAGKWEQ